MGQPEVNVEPPPDPNIASREANRDRRRERQSMLSALARSTTASDRVQVPGLGGNIRKT